MASYVRDKVVRNITIGVDALRQLFTDLDHHLSTMPEFIASDTDQRDGMLMITIRFDERGCRVFTIKDLVDYFTDAKDVERVIFEIVTKDSIETNRQIGSYLELQLDKSENIICFFTVSSDNEAWVNSTFSAINEVLSRHSNKHDLIRNPVVDIFFRIVSLLIGFVISLWGGAMLAPYLAIDNASLISFMFILLVFSTLWSPIGSGIRSIVNIIFPTIKFDRPRKGYLRLLVISIIGGIFVAAVLYLLKLSFSYLAEILGGFVNTS